MTSIPRGVLLRALAAATILGIAACATLPVDYPRSESHALTDTADTALGRGWRQALSVEAGQDAFQPLSLGVDALLARIALARAAERSLDIMYYIWKDDLVGRHLASAVLAAADRGVRVRILLDDVGSDVDDNRLTVLQTHPNIEIRLFNPLATRGGLRFLEMAGDFDRVNRRMHNKAFIADNQRAILGGRNIADEYFEASGVSNFTDLDVALAGPVVPQVSAMFDAFWNAPTAYPIRAITGRTPPAGDLATLRQALAEFVASQHESPYVQRARTRSEELLLGASDVRYYTGIAQFVFDDPAKVTRDRSSKEGRLLPQFATLGGPLTHELTIVSPYFVPGDAGVAWLSALVDRGVRVTVLTNSLASSDVAAVHAGYKRYRERLVSHGVRLYELRPDAFEVVRGRGGQAVASEKASLHAKVFYFDRQAVFIGSLNLDPRSVQLNTEMGVVCRNAAMVEEQLGKLEPLLDRIAWRVEEDTDDAGRKRLAWVQAGDDGVHKLSEEPGSSGWRKFQVWFLGLLPVESQL